MANPRRTVFILGGSADIGRALAERYLAQGCAVALTYRRREAITDMMARPNLATIECDVSKQDSVERAVVEFAALGWRWDQFLSSVGTMEPIGAFFETDFNQWQHSVAVNALGQLRMLHEIYRLRHVGTTCGAMFFAGGGTNNPFRNYSAYAASKILLIKMAELLDDEAPDLNVFVVGPGFVRTKIHNETMQASDRAGANLQKTLDFLKSDGTSFDDLFASIEWCFTEGRAVVGGRNVSTVYDPWRNGGAEFAANLAADPDLCKLRRRHPHFHTTVPTRPVSA